MYVSVMPFPLDVLPRFFRTRNNEIDSIKIHYNAQGEQHDGLQVFHNQIDRRTALYELGLKAIAGCFG